MNTEVRNTPNIVVDDNYRMLVNRLTRRYAERGASIYTDAEAIEQERSDARARAIAPDAYRISRTLGDNAEMYKSDNGQGVRYMTTDDYLVYFSKCHDAFDAVNYYNLHSDAPAAQAEEGVKPRVLVNRKRLEAAKRDAVAPAKPAPKRKKTAEIVEFPQEQEGFSSRVRVIRRRATAVLAAMSASLAILIGGVTAFAPASQEVNARELPQEHVDVMEEDVQEVLSNQE